MVFKNDKGSKNKDLIFVNSRVSFNFYIIVASTLGNFCQKPQCRDPSAEGLVGNGALT